MLKGAAARWLASRREELNRRFARARRRYPNLSSDLVNGMLEATLPGLAGDEPGADTLCESVYDLILFHAGRGSFALRPGLDVLLRESFPRLHAHLLERSTSLPARLSNAVENLAGRGLDMARGLGTLAAMVPDAKALLDAGALLAWRLGEARLREAALAAAGKLPAKALLFALGLPEWPEQASPLALLALSSDAWHAPAERLSASTLRDLATGASDATSLGAALVAEPPKSQPAEWKRVARLGDFAGLGGAFERPPLVLDGGDCHRFHVRSGEVFFLVHADVFGCVCRPTADPRLPVRVPGKRGRAPEPDTRLVGAGMTSFVEFANVLLVTYADSHRLHAFARTRTAC
jgi:hypothetical protein